MARFSAKHFDPIYAMKLTRGISPTRLNEKILPADSPLHPHTEYLQEEEAAALERRREEEKLMEFERLRELIKSGSYGSMAGKGPSFKAGGMVRKSRGDGKARRGRTRGRII